MSYLRNVFKCIFIAYFSGIPSYINADCEDEDIVVCSPVVTMNWCNFPPYIYKDIAEIKGVLKLIIEKLIGECCCCGSSIDCVAFKYLPPSHNTDHVQKDIGMYDADVSFPLYGSLNTVKLGNHSFFSVIESPGIIFLHGVESMSKISTGVIHAAFSAWPVLVVSLMMATISGIIIWSLDSYWNPEEFPVTFIKGAWEGFWCAFISMTTVGYGDKAPKSMTARLFTMCWVLVGLVVISIFIATITTTLTALSMSSESALYGKNLVVLENGEEYRYGVRTNNNMHVVGNMTDFIDFIKNFVDKSGNMIHGGLVDAYVAGHHVGRLKEENGIRFASVIDHQFVYGFVTSNKLANATFTRCLRRKLSLNENFILTRVQKDINALPYPEESEAEERSSNLFDHKSHIFQQAMLTLVGIIAFFVICGISWRSFYSGNKVTEYAGEDEPRDADIPKPVSYEKLILTQCQEFETTMMAEVVSFNRIFEEKLEEIKNQSYS